MASTAISAQGTKLYIAGTAGGAKTVTTVTVGIVTIMTSTAHGFQVGDYITYDSNFAGTNAADLNGKSFTVTNKSTDTYAVNFNSLGRTITAGTAAATAGAWVQIKNLTAAKGIDGSAKEIDVTNHDSSAVEVVLGLQDNGQFSVTVDGDNADAGQVACQAARTDGAIRTFKYTLPAGSLPNATFNGFVKKFDVDATVNDKFKRSLDIRISGAVTFS